MGKGTAEVSSEEKRNGFGKKIDSEAIVRRWANDWRSDVEGGSSFSRLTLFLSPSKKGEKGRRSRANNMTVVLKRGMNLRLYNEV